MDMVSGFSNVLLLTQRITRMTYCHFFEWDLALLFVWLATSLPNHRYHVANEKKVIKIRHFFQISWWFLHLFSYKIEKWFKVIIGRTCKIHKSVAANSVCLLLYTQFRPDENEVHQIAIALPTPISVNWAGNIIAKSMGNSTVVLIPNEKQLMGVTWDSAKETLDVWKATDQTFDQLFHLVPNITKYVCIKFLSQI